MFLKKFYHKILIWVIKITNDAHQNFWFKWSSKKKKKVTDSFLCFEFVLNLQKINEFTLKHMNILSNRAKKSINELSKVWKHLHNFNCFVVSISGRVDYGVYSSYITKEMRIDEIPVLANSVTTSCLMLFIMQLSYDFISHLLSMTLTPINLKKLLPFRT